MNTRERERGREREREGERGREREREGERGRERERYTENLLILSRKKMYGTTRSAENETI